MSNLKLESSRCRHSLKSLLTELVFVVLINLRLYVCDKYFKLQIVNHRLHASRFMFAREFLAGEILLTRILIRG